jgi:4-hydroxythreonine-4-phosphate dehydrogenase
MSDSTALPLALTLGEPAGIGPDLTLQLWHRRVELRLPAFYLIADPEFIKRRARLLGLDVAVSVAKPAQTTDMFGHALPISALDSPVTATPGRPDASSAPSAIASIQRAVADVLAGHAAAIVTNPVAKNVLYRSGFAEPGHTEFLAKLVKESTGKTATPVMMLWSPELAVVPVTIHLPFRDVVTKLTSELVAKTARIVARDLAARSAFRGRALS